jgi:hypothetical protein
LLSLFLPIEMTDINAPWLWAIHELRRNVTPEKFDMNEKWQTCTIIFWNSKLLKSTLSSENKTNFSKKQSGKKKWVKPFISVQQSTLKPTELLSYAMKFEMNI